jgi:multisubunit Na+/H+ antiporter MnhB subunit
MNPMHRGVRVRAAAGAILSIGIAAAIAMAVAQDPVGPAPVAREVVERLPDAGAAHPVTAVLLDFRAYDTWLEVCVVLAATLGALVVARRSDARDRPPPPADPVLTGMAAIVLPLGVATAGILLWLGTSAPGGAFQAGSVLAGVLLLAWLAGHRTVDLMGPQSLATALVAGAAAFTAVAVITLIAGRAMLDLPQAHGGGIIVAIEAGVMVSVAASLALMILVVRPPGGQT